MAGYYSCGRCGRMVSKDTHRCPHCSALLSGIRCRSCSYTGTESDFYGDRCPRCGSAVNRAGAGSGAGGGVGVLVLIAIIAGAIWAGNKKSDPAPKPAPSAAHVNHAPTADSTAAARP